MDPFYYLILINRIKRRGAVAGATKNEIEEGDINNLIEYALSRFEPVRLTF